MQPLLGVRFFRSAAGTEPVREWLRDLPVEHRRAIGTDIKTVQYGWPLGMPLVRKLEPGLWELRSHIADGIARVLFTVHGADLVLLHGFIKKSGRIPVDELDTARQRLALFSRWADRG